MPREFLSENLNPTRLKQQAIFHTFLLDPHQRRAAPHRDTRKLLERQMPYRQS